MDRCSEETPCLHRKFTEDMLCNAPNSNESKWCSRPTKHAGNHFACGTEHNYDIWDDIPLGMEAKTIPSLDLNPTP